MMKLITRLHLAAHTIDLALTFLAVRWRLAGELNPLGFNAVSVGLKFIVVMLVAVVLEKIKILRLTWLIVVIPVLFVAWNGFNIVFS
jgi:hypothetical protein